MNFTRALGLVAVLVLGASELRAHDDDHAKHARPGPAPAAASAPGTVGGMADMHAHMQAMHEHSRMMEGIGDPAQLGEEMKKHMRMMDEMMEAMMKTHGSAAAPSNAPHKP